MATYTIDPATGTITNDACEINVVHHCNLSCRGCTHLSPLWHKQFIEEFEPAHIHEMSSVEIDAYAGRGA